MKRYSLLLTILLLSNTTCIANLLNNINQNLEFIVGFYWNYLVSEYKPLILTSEGAGDNWTFTKIPMFPNNVSHTLTTISCKDNTCVAGGLINDTPLPLLLKTYDAGVSWSYITNFTTLPKMKWGEISNISFNKETWLATGYYNTPDTKIIRPLILVSQDKGFSWCSINQIKNLPNSNGLVISRSVCDDITCVGILAGYPYNTRSINIMTPIFSTDKGQTWTYVIHVLDLPAAKNLNLYTLECKKGTCVAGGMYLPPDQSYNSQPILITSFDSGQNWTAVKEIVDLPVMENGNIRSLAYNKHKWFAVGMYNDEQKPLVLMKDNEDQGSHWKVIKNITGIPEKYPVIKKIECQDNYCVIGGLYMINDGNYYQPFILTSNDNGDSFHRANIANVPRMKDLNINAIRCKNATCIALGAYVSFDRAVSSFILTSIDRGENWSLAQIKNIPNDAKDILLLLSIS